LTANNPIFRKNDLHDNHHAEMSMTTIIQIVKR